MIRMKALRLFYTTVFALMSVVSVLAQEEAEATAETANVGPGWMIAIIGLGVLVIVGLGAAMSAQQSDEEKAHQ